MMIKVNRCLALAAPVIAAFFLVSPAANAHCNYPGQQYGSLGSFQQNLGSGMLTPSQAQDMARRQNDLAARTARLMRNDGGVLTPRDSAKIQKQALENQQIYNEYLAQNAGSYGYGNGLYGSNTGVLGSLFGGGNGLSGLGTAYNPYGTAYNPYGTAYNPYGNAGYDSAYNPYGTYGNSLLGNQFSPYGTGYGGTSLSGLANVARSFLGY